MNKERTPIEIALMHIKWAHHKFEQAVELMIKGRSGSPYFKDAQDSYIKAKNALIDDKEHYHLQNYLTSCAHNLHILIDKKEL